MKSYLSTRESLFLLMIVIFLTGFAGAKVIIKDTEGLDLNGNDLLNVGNLQLPDSGSGYEAKLGDANYDGSITVQDVLYIFNKKGTADCPASRCDINQDGTVDIVDVHALYTDLTGEVTNLPDESRWLIDSSAFVMEYGEITMPAGFPLNMKGESIKNLGGLESLNDLDLYADSDGGDGGPYHCWVSANDGSWNCDGTKNFVQEVNSTHEVVYTSQESGEVRAVWEESGVLLENGEGVVNPPAHFQKVVDGSEPMIVHVTPVDRPVSVAVGDESPSSVEIVTDSEEDVRVDVTVKGIRKGYAGKQITRKTGN